MKNEEKIIMCVADIDSKSLRNQGFRFDIIIDVLRCSRRSAVAIIKILKYNREKQYPG